MCSFVNWERSQHEERGCIAIAFMHLIRLQCKYILKSIILVDIIVFLIILHTIIVSKKTLCMVRCMVSKLKGKV